MEGKKSVNTKIIQLIRFLVIGVFLLSSLTSFAQEKAEKDITLEYIYKKDELDLKPVNPSLPRAMQWSTEGHLLSYLVSAVTEAPHLVFYDPAKDATAYLITPFALHDAMVELATKPEGVPVPHTSQFQTIMGDSREHANIGRYEWVKDKNAVRLHVDGKKYIWNMETYHLKEEKTEKRDLPEGQKNDVTNSPNERYAAYTRDNDLYAYDFEQRKEIRLTNDGSEQILNGRLTWVYWEELHYRRGWKGFYWSPNNDAIAYLQFNEKDVSTYPITDFSSAVPKTRDMFYPKAGTKNPTVRLGVVSLSTRNTQWIDLNEPYEYIARVSWHPSGEFLTVQALNRAQTELTLLYADPTDGTSKVILKEKDDVWVNAHGGPYFLEEDDAFLWLSERSGYRHLYRYSMDGEKCQQLTKGEWEVNPSMWSISIDIDEEHKKVYFNANKSSPLDKHYYSVSLNGGRVKQLTHGDGNHSSCSFSADYEYALDHYNNTHIPKRLQIIDRHGKLCRVLGETTKEDYAPYRMGSPELLTLDSPAGLTFHAKMLKPADFDPNKKYPVILYVYGGPAGQVARNTFVNPMDMVFVNRGFLYFSFDTRGTPGRGREWINAIHKNTCDKPLEDLQYAVEYLESLPYVDGENIGIWGWSNGGYMTCCAMLKKPGLFQAGVAVAPVTDWHLYDTIYTERYMSHPDTNAEGYKESAPIHFADQLEGHLMLAHGISDDNVHVQNIYNLVDKLIEAEKDYDLYLYPQREHGIGGSKRRYHLYDHIFTFFEKHLIDDED